MHAGEKTTSANEAAQFSSDLVSTTPQAIRDSSATTIVLALHFPSLNLNRGNRARRLAMAMAMDLHQVSCDLIGFKLMEAPLIGRMVIPLLRAFREPNPPLGTGYSSLACLLFFSSLRLKIARRFIFDIAVNPEHPQDRAANHGDNASPGSVLHCRRHRSRGTAVLNTRSGGNELQGILVIPPIEIQAALGLPVRCLPWIGLINRMSDAATSIDTNQTQWRVHRRNSAQEHQAGSWGELVASGGLMEGRALCTTG